MNENKCVEKLPEIKVIITGGDLRIGEYMVRYANRNQIYELIRDGFNVERAGE